MFDQADLKNAIAQLAMCEFFPSDPNTRAAIMELLAKICPHKQALEWLTETMVNRVGKWHGPAELRGVLASRYLPADGVEGTCNSTPGFTPPDQEMRAIESHYERKQLESPRTATLQLTGKIDTEEEEAELRKRLEEIGVNSGDVKPSRPRAEDLLAAREFHEQLSPTEFAPDEFSPVKPTKSAVSLREAADTLADAIAAKQHELQSWAEKTNREALKREPWYRNLQKLRNA